MDPQLQLLLGDTVSLASGWGAVFSLLSPWPPGISELPLVVSFGHSFPRVREIKPGSVIQVLDIQDGGENKTRGLCFNFMKFSIFAKTVKSTMEVLDNCIFLVFKVIIEVINFKKNICMYIWCMYVYMYLCVYVCMFMCFYMTG